MKKPYIEPEIELITLGIKTDVLFHSPFESDGTNRLWDWNDNHDYPTSNDPDPEDDLFL